MLVGSFQPVMFNATTIGEIEPAFLRHRAEFIPVPPPEFKVIPNPVTAALLGVQAADIGDDMLEIGIRQGRAATPRGHGDAGGVQGVCHRTSALQKGQ